MHDYVKGAFEALSWVQLLLQDLRDNPVRAVEKTLEEVDKALGDIKNGVASDFRWKLQPR